MKRFLAILVLLSFAGAISVSNFSTDKESYSPGDRGSLTLNINFDFPVESTQELVGFNAINVELDSPIFSDSIFLGKVSKGEMSISFPFRVGEDTLQGLYGIKVTISGSAVIKEGTSTKEKVALARSIVPLKVVVVPKMALFVSPTELARQGTLNLTICAQGGKARELSVSSEELYLEGGNVFFGDVEGCSSKQLSYDATGLDVGTKKVGFSIDFKDLLGDSHSEELLVPLTISKDESRFVIKQTGKIYHKKVAPFSLSIKNNGAYAEDVRIRSKGELLFSGISEVAVGDIPKGQEKEVSVDAYTELFPGTNNVELEVLWKEEGKEMRETIPFAIYVEDTPPIEVFVEASPTPLISGQEHTLSVVVANRASYPLSAVSASVESDILEVLEIQKERFIGSLEADDFSSQQFKVKVLRQGEGEINLTINYRDPSGKDRSISKSIKVVAGQKEEDRGPLLLGLIALVIGVVFLAKALEKIRSKK